jgi:hypothetical protein
VLPASPAAAITQQANGKKAYHYYGTLSYLLREYVEGCTEQTLREKKHAGY